MDGRSRGVGTTDAPPDESPGRWGWVAGLAIVLFAFVGLVGAVLLIPGHPFGCTIPNPSAWMLCGWFRTFVTNLVGMVLMLAGGSLVLAFLVAIPRAILRAIRESFVDVYLLNRGQTYPDKAMLSVQENRSQAYPKELATLFRQVNGGSVTVSEQNVHLSADAARNLYGKFGSVELVCRLPVKCDV